ncbi:hypothetical protein MIND_01382200 [Mycena indigotica]|uniref:rRNA-processing protein EFG1 n=1 Tax=Mycena indigotica TaxID=2126181 RepID=A0A8H6S0T7_9AGAR|nr:uncharacterized protein MIND_01382200 [Mycena indigotica]KAF7289210.1 hypothetical protein MIND_01382200 [Mycena indigotica]
MGPTRTDSRKANRKEGGPVAGPSKPRQDGKSKKHANKHRAKHTLQEANATPGLQKIKASLRQTRRLLAKDNLAGDVRAETERRLKALETDLAAAERGKKERTMAVRYHKVKFFERQKVLRKLTQVKKQHPVPEEALHTLRVDLNYILHYPKTKKYISLFPPELRKGESSEPSVDTGREQVREWVRQRMETGEMAAEPELNLDSRGGGVDWEGVPSDKPGSQENAMMELDEQDDFFDNEE